MKKKTLVALAAISVLAAPASAGSAPDQGDRLVDTFRVCSQPMPGPARIWLRYMCWALNA